MKARLTNLKYTVTAGIMLLTCGTAGVLRAEPVEDPVHFDEMAALVQSRANSLCWEMHRFHRHQPDFAETYRLAKEVWALSGSLRDLLRSGPVDATTVAQQAQRVSEVFNQVEQRAARWEASPPAEPVGIPVEERGVVVTPRAGLDIDVPFFGLRLGNPGGVVVREETRLRMLERRRPHVNARGSTRSLQRELDATKIAVSYLNEDAGAGIAPVTAPSGESLPPQGPTQPAPAAGPVLKIAPPSKDPKTADKR